MGDGSDRIALPPRIHAHLADRVRRAWVGEGRESQPVVEALPDSLPAGEVTRVVSGGPFGWLIDARLDRVGGRVALEVLEDDRMSGPDHYRVWEDGSREELETEHTTMIFPKDCSPEDAERIKERFYAHNRAVQELLVERGFIRR